MANLILGLGDSLIGGCECESPPKHSFIATVAKEFGWDHLVIAESGISNLATIINAFTSDFDWSKYDKKIIIINIAHYQKLSLLADRREDRNWETFLPKGKKWASWSENKILVNNGLKEFITPELGQKQFYSDYKLLEAFKTLHGFSDIFMIPSLENLTKEFFSPDIEGYNEFPWENMLEIDGIRTSWHWCYWKAHGVIDYNARIDQDWWLFSKGEKRTRYFHERGHPKEEMQELYGKAVANHLKEKKEKI